MNISGIRLGTGFYDYNTIKNNEVSGQQVRSVETIPAVREEMREDRQEFEAQRTEADKKDFGAAEYAMRYQPDACYELKGAESDIMCLDVEKAISDMKKDQVLQQYQFFVGESQTEAILLETREKENFSL